MGIRIQDSADVSPEATIGDGSSVWHLAQVREGAVLGKNCIIGRGAYVGTGVLMGDNCKLQNYALVYEPAVLEDGVFVGPGTDRTVGAGCRRVRGDQGCARLRPRGWRSRTADTLGRPRWSPPGTGGRGHLQMPPDRRNVCRSQ